MQPVKIGHYSDHQKGTGLSVFIFDEPAVGTYYICGSSVASRELHLLDLESNANHIDALLLTGGSAFGLGATDGVMRWLLEHSRGKKMPHGGVVPMVATAAIYDLAVKSATPPTIENAYQACCDAIINNSMQGQVGAGTGATIGKIIPNASKAAGGLGFAKMSYPNGLEIMVYAVVNAVGDIYNTAGKIIAGAKNKDNSFADCKAYLLSGHAEKHLTQENTTLVAVFTNAAFNKIALRRIAKMVTAGVGRAISPIFTRYDGDIVFCISVGKIDASELMVGAIAAELAHQAIVNAVVNASQRTCTE